MAKQKLTEAVTVHLSTDLSEAIKNVSFKDGVTPSKWLRDLANKELKNQYLQAKSTVATLAMLENAENCENGFEDFDDG
jgi:hypothetical protein